MKRTRILIVLLLVLCKVATAAELPVKIFNGTDKTKPLLFYISGDGGWNGFSMSLVQSLNQQGFTVIGLDAESYFWTRKTPEQAAQDVTSLLMQHSSQWNQNGMVLIGYSLGADVLPFIQTRLPQALVQHIQKTVLLSPSERTDFEVHLLDAFTSAKHAYPVMDEINKWQKPVTIFFGADEDSTYKKALTSKTIHVITVAGGHHYSSAIASITTLIAKEIQH